MGSAAKRIRKPHASTSSANSALRRRIAELERENVSLHESQLFLDSLLENIPDMIFVKDARELRFVRFNRAGERLLGYPREHLIGKSDYDFFPPKEADFFVEKDRHVLQRKAMVDIPEEPIHTRAHGERTLHTKKIPVLDAQGQPVYLLGISEDVTERRRAERQEAETQKKVALLEAEKILREQLVSMLSHDLRNPLASVQLRLELLLRRKEELPWAAPSLQKALTELRRIDQMIQEFLDTSALRAGRPLRVRITSCDLAQIARVTHEAFSLLPGRQLVLDCPESLSGEWDADAIRRALENLIQNAVKHGAIDRPITVRLRKAGRKVRLEVHNFGPPIPAAVQARLFEAPSGPLPRAEAGPRNARSKGWGLGLFIVKAIADAHHGKVSVKSSEKAGTTVVVELPLKG